MEEDARLSTLLSSSGTHHKRKFDIKSSSSEFKRKQKKKMISVDTSLCLHQSGVSTMTDFDRMSQVEL